MNNNRIYIGDSRYILPTLYDEFGGKVALLVTSPPYFVGRGYESYIETFSDYWDLIYAVFTYADLLMEPFGKIAVNFADRYANAKEYGRQLEIPYLPYYQQVFGKLNYDLWARVIWDKKSSAIEGSKHIAQKTRFTGQMRVAPNWEYIFVWRKQSGGTPPEKQLDMTKEEWTEWVNGIWRFRSVIKNKTIGNTKLAIFPDRLPYRLIKMFTQVGDIVIDPFCGTGTTIKIARQLGRIGIGIEKNPEMLETLQLNLQPDMFSGNVEFYYDRADDTK